MTNGTANPDGLTAACPALATRTGEIVGDGDADHGAMPRSYRRDDRDTLLPEGTIIPASEIDRALDEPFAHARCRLLGSRPDAGRARKA